MCILVIMIFLILSIISHKISHSFLHPSFVTCFLWGVLLTIYQFTDHGLYPLSNKFYYAILLWVIPFSIISLWTARFHIKLLPCISTEHNKLVYRMYPIIGLCLIIAIYGLYLKGLYYNPENIFNGIRAAGVASLNGEEEEFIFPLYIRIANFFADMSLVVGLAIFFENKKKLPFAIFLLLILVFYIFRSNKTVIAQLILSFGVLRLLAGKISRKTVLVSIILIVVLMLLTHLLRRKELDNFDIIQFISIYLLAPLPGFDSILNTHYNYINSFHGEYTFRFFIPYLQLLGLNIEGNPDPFNLHNWTNTPLPVNVYTSMFGCYIDFGYLGILLFSIIGGFFWGLLYKFAKENYPIGKILYSIFFYILIFQFFNDYLIQFLGANIMIILITLMFYTHVTIGRQKYQS